MRPFTQLNGIVAALDRENVDTDQIIPKQFLKRIERTGYGQFLFHDWRSEPDFELNLPAFSGATILLVGANFGCGSSREHAPWALRDYGFRAVIAPSFADIFYSNCLHNGMLPVRLAQTTVRKLFDRVAAQPGCRLEVDLHRCVVSDADGWRSTFEIEPFHRHCLLNGLDAISLTLQHEDRIREFEEAK